MYLNLIKSIYYKLVANIILNSEKLKAFPLRSRTRQGFPTLATFIKHRIENPNQEIRQEKEIKSIQIRKDKVKLSLKL